MANLRKKVKPDTYLLFLTLFCCGSILEAIITSFEALRDSMEKNVSKFAFSWFPKREWFTRATMCIGISLYDKPI